MSNHGSWSLPQLKEELRKRKARISGRKHELIERLEAYDRNKDFGNQDKVGEEYSMTLPDSFLYKDFNSGTEFVNFKMETIEVYLKPMDKVLDSDAKNLYKEKFLKYIRLAKYDNTFLV